ncbi:MAG: hypothetical protein NC411_01520 [Bacteroides sp.]|nr:hypothetical protein [Bacteroides sp.]
MKNSSQQTSVSKNPSSLSQLTAAARRATFPVSKKFYASIVDRVTEVCSLFPSLSLSVTMAAIDEYMVDGRIPEMASGSEIVMIFTLLRSEINRAMARSVAARSRAAHRKSAAADNDGDKAIKMTPPTVENADDETEKRMPPPASYEILSRSRRRAIEREKRRLSRRRIKPLCGKKG